MDKKISIILNSRNRVNLLSNLFSSIINNTNNIEDIEVLVSCDLDDEDTKTFAKLNNKNFIHFYFIYREKNLHKRLNDLSRICSGKYIFVLNDDCEISTKNWDKIAYNILENSNKEIIYGRTIDNSCDKSGDKEYASFPIISKKAVEVLGFFMHERFVGLGGDVGIYRVYKAANKIVDIPININHKLHETVEQVFNPDRVAQEMRENTYRGYTDFFTFDITQDINKIKDYEKTINNI